MENNADPDETLSLIWVCAICKCSYLYFCINALATSPKLCTLSFRQAMPLIEPSANGTKNCTHGTHNSDGSLMLVQVVDTEYRLFPEIAL